MAYTQKIETKWLGDSREIPATVEETANAKASFDEVVPIAASDKEYAFAFDITKLKLHRLLAAQDLTIKTNSSGTPDDTISLVKDAPYDWADATSYDQTPFTVDVSSIFVTNASGVEARLQIEVLYDSTV